MHQRNFNANEINFHPVLNDIENMFWFFLLSTRALGDSHVQNFLKTCDEGLFTESLEKFNKAVSFKKGATHPIPRMNIQDNILFLGKAMALMTYDYILSSKYQSRITDCDAFRFLKFIRIGAAHGNQLSLKYVYGEHKGDWILKKNEQVKWEDKIITRALHNTPVFNGFVTMFDIFFIADDLSKKLKEFDGQN